MCYWFVAVYSLFYCSVVVGLWLTHVPGENIEYHIHAYLPMHLGSRVFVQCDCLSTSCNRHLNWKPVSCHTFLWGQTSTAASVLFSPSPSFACSRAQDASSSANTASPQEAFISDGQHLMFKISTQLRNVFSLLISFYPSLYLFTLNSSYLVH